MEKLKLRRSAREDSMRIEKLVYEDYFRRAPMLDGFDEEERVCKKIVDKEGNIIAGCDAYIYPWGVMYVDDMWVDERYRRQEIGSNLLQAVEEVGKSRGCHLAYLDTGDFQAKPFYLKHGYTVFATLKDNPKGHEDYQLFKRLDNDQPKRACKPIEYELSDGSEDDCDIIEENLDSFNELHLVSKHEYIKINRKLVDENGKVVAAMMAGVSEFDIGYIWKIWVDEDCRGKGLGTLLLKHFEKKAKEKGATKILSEEIYDWNVGFFVKAGYSIAGELPDLPKGHTYCVVEKGL